MMTIRNAKTKKKIAEIDDDGTMTLFDYREQGERFYKDVEYTVESRDKDAAS